MLDSLLEIAQAIGWLPVLAIVILLGGYLLQVQKRHIDFLKDKNAELEKELGKIDSNVPRSKAKITQQITKKDDGAFSILDAKSRNQVIESNLLANIPSDPESWISIDKLVEDQNPLEEENSYVKWQYASLLSLLHDLGLVKIEQTNRQYLVRPVSILAGAFLRSMGFHIKHNLDYIGGWSEHGRDNPDAQRPRQILRSIEERRVKEIGRDKAEPSRYTKASLAIIKGRDENGQERYLLQWTDSWGDGRFSFIGGNMEPGDKDFEGCMYRELKEEINLAKEDILTCRRIGEDVLERQISLRLGAFTDYTYVLFFVTLNVESERVKALFPSIEYKIKTRLAWVEKVERANRWNTWNEILRDRLLNRDAKILLNELNRIDVGSLPLSCGLRIPIR